MSQYRIDTSAARQLTATTPRGRYELMLRGYRLEALKHMAGIDPEHRLPGTTQEVINGLAKQLADLKFNN
ncbi:hypothetical protein [Serratia liquefaciens]|uniref:hypothetical protein n=1 Tax=Serratia liquefaciens TaxID=614 RepID=UPI003B42B0B2